MNDIIGGLPDGRLACALFVFIIAVLESFIVSTFFVPGTMAAVAIGVLVQTGRLPAWMVVAIWAGTFAGDLASFMIARYAGNRIRRWKKLAPLIDRGEAAFQRRPVFFSLASRGTPYLKSCAPTLAGLTHFPITAFLLINFAASAFEVCVFVGAGMIGTAAALSVNVTTRFANFAGLGVLVIVVLLLVRECVRCPVCKIDRSQRKRGAVWIIRCLIKLGPWNVLGWFEDILGFWNRRCIRENTMRCLAQARVGDIILVARTYDAPWDGPWTHSAIITNPSGDGLVVHAFHRVVEESFRSLPRRARICLLRVQAEQQVIDRAVAEARRHLGARFSLLARRHKDKSPIKFSCSLLVWHAFKRAGCDLVHGDSGFVTPQDLAESSKVEVVCDFRCPSETDGGNSFPGGVSWPSHVRELAKRLLTIFRARGHGRTVIKMLLSLK